MVQRCGVLIQSCSSSLGRKCIYIVLLVFSYYLLDVNQWTSWNTANTGGDVDDNCEMASGTVQPAEVHQLFNSKVDILMLSSRVAPSEYPNLCSPWVSDLHALLPGVEAGGNDGQWVFRAKVNWSKNGGTDHRRQTRLW